MNKVFRAKVHGLEDVLRKINRTNKQLSDGVERELNNATQNVKAEALRLVPRGRQMRLANSIQSNTADKFHKSVTVGAPFSAFVEFGTGSRVFDGPFAFSDEHKKYARQFFVSGKGMMPSRPFLFPAFEAEIPKLSARLRKLFYN